MPVYDFDQILDRRNSDSAKWNRYGADVLPMWVADMDFIALPEVLEALHKRVDHGVFGYGGDADTLRRLIVERVQTKYSWTISEDAIVFLPGLVSGFNIAARAIGRRHDGVLICTPVYFPMLIAPENQYRTLQDAPLAVSRTTVDGLETIYYEMDMDAIDAAITSETKLHILCNPHNPVGRAYTQPELAALAEKCLANDVIICSDEIHCDLLLGNVQHTPIASLDPEIARRSITLMAPSKTYNLPGLGCCFAIIPDAELRAQYERSARGIVPHVGVMGYTATVAAYTHGAEWEAQLLRYLEGNRDAILDYVRHNLPGVAVTIPEATYLGWLDCNALNQPGNVQEFLINQGKVAFNDGAAFGKNGEGFVRFNFGCPRATVYEGLERIQSALSSLD